jgi:hypothetical protein
VVDVTYEVRKGGLVDFGRIEISGNAKTRDKVIRRQLRWLKGHDIVRPIWRGVSGICGDLTILKKLKWTPGKEKLPTG